MSPNEGQVEVWNGGESVHFVTHADRYDRQLATFTIALLGVGVEPITTTVLLAGGDTVAGSLDFLLGMGMVRGLLGRLDGDAREQAIEEIRTTLAERYVPDVGVTLGAAGWLVSARN